MQIFIFIFQRQQNKKTTKTEEIAIVKIKLHNSDNTKSDKRFVFYIMYNIILKFA